MQKIREATTHTVKVVLTIDTEPDNAWENHNNTSVSNIQELLRLQKLLAKYGAKATCLVTSRILQDAKAVDVLRELVEVSGAEIGAHLHPWETAPFMECGSDREFPAFPHELPVGIFEKKIETLTEELSKHFPTPTAYRAGRWGIVAEHLPILENAGYLVDTSVTPLIDWRTTVGMSNSRGGRGGVDYRCAPWHPYHPDYADVCAEGEARILEMPVTVEFQKRLPGMAKRAYSFMPYLFKRVFRKVGLMRPVWAMPAGERKDDLTRMMKAFPYDKNRHFNIAFHSSELMAGGSPSTRTLTATDGMFSRIGVMLEALSKSGVCEFATVSEAAKSL